MASMHFSQFNQLDGPQLELLFGRLMKLHEVVVVKSVPIDTNDPFIRMARALGNLSLEGVSTTSNTLEDGCVHLVMRHQRPVIDPFGNVITSTTNLDFQLHSDEYFSTNPATFLLLLCVRQSLHGGDSLISLIDSVIPLLDDDTRRLLEDPVYPSKIGPVPILIRSEAGYRVRFNQLEMRRAEQGGFAPVCDAAHSEVLARLIDSAMKRAIQFRLQPGDCLVVENRKVLHGRVGFEDTPTRLLKRLRVK